VRSFFARKLVLAAIGLLILGGAATAIAATQDSHGSSRQAYINDVAKHLNVAPSALSAALKAADSDRIDQALAAGRISRTRADALKQRVQQGANVPLFGHSLGAGARAGGRGGVVVQYLGIARATLHSELAAGKSLAQIASATPGKSVQGLKAALTTAATQRLAKALSSGRITGQQQAKRLSKLSSRIDALLQRPGLGARKGAAARHRH
jgi:hypothetical protein